MTVKLRCCLLLFISVAFVCLVRSDGWCQHVLRNVSSAPSGLVVNSFWTVSISTEQLKSFKDPQLKLKPVVKAKVSFGSTEQAYPSKYEDLWYGTEEQGLCIGAYRYGAFTVPVRDYVAIKVLDNESASSEQINASTDAIVRMLLDVQLNDDWVEAVVVPDALFKPIKDKLHFYNIRTFGSGESGADSGSTFDFVLQSESGRQTATMVCRT